MVEIQTVALELFLVDGFAKVTMNAIAGAAGVGVATVYRYFGTKEDLVILDENEDLVVDAIMANLTELPAVAAVRTALVELAPVHETITSLELVRLACNEPAIVHATSLSDRQATNELASAFREHDPSMTLIMASAVARACFGAVETAFDHWQAGNASTSLATIIEETFDAIGAHWPRIS